jgi:hypothetical protein
MSESSNSAPTHVQINIYRLHYGHFEYLLLKRIDDQTEEFWQPVTEPVIHDNIAETVKWAASKQTGINHFKRLSEETYSYGWYANGQQGRDLVFAAEVDDEVEPEVDTGRYHSFSWFRFNEAMQHLKWSGAKDALRNLNQYLEAKKISDPDYWSAPTTGLYATKSKAGKNKLTHTEAPVGPYGPNVPKRLPDRPEDSHENLIHEEQQEVNTGEWFL